MAAQRPQYGHSHRRIRAALLASGEWVGKPCVRCGVPLRWEDRDRLHLDHKVDRFGRRVGDNVYEGFSHASCNTAAQAFGRAPRRPALEAVPDSGSRKPGRDWLRMTPLCSGREHIHWPCPVRAR